jgi:hypothetical protein
MAFDGRRFLALAFLRRLLVVLTPAQLCQNAGFLAGTLEAAQSTVKMFTFSDSYARHIELSETTLAGYPASEPIILAAQRPLCKAR